MNKHWGLLPTQLMLSCRGWPPLMCNDAGGSGPWPRHHYNGSSLTSSLTSKNTGETFKWIDENSEGGKMSSHLTYFSIHRFSRTNCCVDKMNEYLNLLFLNYGCASLWLLMPGASRAWLAWSLGVSHIILVPEMHSEQESVIVSTNNYIALIASVNQ